MIGAERPQLVGAVFADRAGAGAAAEDLRRAGKADHELLYAVWSDGQHAIGTHAEPTAGRATATGAALGGVTGMVVVAALSAVIWSGAVWLVSGVAGAIVGAVLRRLCRPQPSASRPLGGAGLGASHRR